MLLIRMKMTAGLIMLRTYKIAKSLTRAKIINSTWFYWMKPPTDLHYFMFYFVEVNTYPGWIRKIILSIFVLILIFLLFRCHAISGSPLLSSSTAISSNCSWRWPIVYWISTRKMKSEGRVHVPSLSAFISH